METGPATQSPVAEVEPCSTSAFWSRRPPATAPRQVAGLSSVVGRCVFGIVNYVHDVHMVVGRNVYRSRVPGAIPKLN